MNRSVYFLVWFLGNHHHLSLLAVAQDVTAAIQDSSKQEPKSSNQGEIWPDETGAILESQGFWIDHPPKEWLVEEFPNLEQKDRACRSSSSSSLSEASAPTTTTTSIYSLCDPDGVLTRGKDAEEIETAISTVRRSSAGICKQEDTDASIEIQIACAMVKKMDLTRYGSSDDGPTKAAEAFARYIHDNWGVGMVTECGGTGIVLFFSVHDRAVYISRGKALETVLTDYRLDQTMEHMKPFLRKGDYKGAILVALEHLDRLIESGEPQFWERLNNFVVEYAGLVWFGCILSYMIWNFRRQQVERRKYAKVESQLSEIDRARAQALQGRYRVESCPICLEAFGKEEEGQEHFSKGPDGQPIKLLRCGHVFCETCWEEWVSIGTGQVNKCPICKQDVGSRSRSRSRSPSRGNATATFDNDDGNLGQADHHPREDVANVEQRALRLYNYERQFRLARLAMRYPRYIGAQQMQRWTQSTYDGPLARDPLFVRNNPSMYAADGSGNSRGGGAMRRPGSCGSGFGGGCSGGGRGGRW